MANEIKLLGKNEILFFYTPIKNAAGTVVAEDYFPIGCLTQNDLNFTFNTNEGTVTKCDTSPIPTYSTKTYEVTFEAVAVEDDGLKATFNDLLATVNTNFDANTPMFWKIETTLSDDTKETIFGKALVSALSRTAPADGEITWSGTLAGIGQTSATDLNV